MDLVAVLRTSAVRRRRITWPEVLPSVVRGWFPQATVKAISTPASPAWSANEHAPSRASGQARLAGLTRLLWRPVLIASALQVSSAAPGTASTRRATNIGEESPERTAGTFSRTSTPSESDSLPAAHSSASTGTPVPDSQIRGSASFDRSRRRALQQARARRRTRAVVDILDRDLPFAGRRIYSRSCQFVWPQDRYQAIKDFTLAVLEHTTPASQSAEHF